MDIRLHFDDMWLEFDPEDNVFTWILRQKHNVVLDPQNPNLVFTMNRRNYLNAFTVYYSPEPFFPDLQTIDSTYDYSMSGFFLDKPNYTRFPLYYSYLHEFIKVGLIDDLSFFLKESREIPSKTKFCSLVIGALHGKRSEFFHKLSRYKQVETNAAPYHHFDIPYDSGHHSSTVPKVDFVKKYKFNIAMENNFRGTYPAFPGAEIENGCVKDLKGHMTEKLVEPFVAGTLPVYWGSKMIGDEFNSNTFLNYYDFGSEDDLIERIIELDNDDDLYASYFSEAIAHTQNNALCESHIISLFDDLISQL